MYAVIKTGGKQYKVFEGRFLEIEKLDLAQGEKVIFEQVLMVVDDDDVKIGTPFVANAKVEAKIIAEGKGKKINIIKFKRRKNSIKRQGHRQLFTKVEISKIML